MRATAIARSTVQREASTAHHQHAQNGLVEDIISAEKAFLAAMRLVLENGLTCACDVAAKEFLQLAPTDQVARRRAHALLRLASERINEGKHS
jgi:hypothetical protein